MQGPLSRAGRFVRWFSHPFVSQEPSFYRVALVCLLASGLFWQMNALNKTYTILFDCPLAWHYDTARYVALRSLPATVPVTVKGQGWKLLRANVGLGIRPADLRPRPQPGTRYLPAAAWERSLRSALEGLELTAWASDTLRLTFDRVATRQLPLALAPDSAHRYAGHLAPARLVFRGPASVLAALPSPYPVPVPDLLPDATEVRLVVPVPDRVRPGATTVLVSGLRVTPKLGRKRR